VVSQDTVKKIQCPQKSAVGETEDDSWGERPNNGKTQAHSKRLLFELSGKEVPVRNQSGGFCNVVRQLSSSKDGSKPTFGVSF